MKRLKLDEANSVEKKNMVSPTIATLFKNNSCRKNLKLNNNEASPDASKVVKKTKTDESSSVAESMETESMVINNKENDCITLD